MPGFADLELQDFELKPYMDTALLLETLSPEDMEMWHNYNFFSDENINSNLKDNIKEENIDMDYCFTSICPNDLISNIDDLNNTNKQPKLEVSNENQKQQSFDYNSSSSSSPNLDDIKTAVGVSLVEQFELAPFILEPSNNFNQIDNHHTTNNYVYELSSSISSLSSTSSVSSPINSISSSPSTTPSIEFLPACNNKLVKNQQQSLQQTGNLQQMKNFSQQNIIIKEANDEINSSGSISTLNPTKKLPKPNQAIIIVESQSKKSSQSIKQLTKNEPTINIQQNKKSTVLPPSPPSSFGSDSESDHSSNNSISAASTSNVVVGTVNTTSIKLLGKPAKHHILKSNTKSNSSLKNATGLLKQIRHQPYTIKSASSISNSESNIKSNKNNQLSITSTKNSNKESHIDKNNANYSDDDCWPFLCSLSKLPTSGPLLLTEEEKRTLIQEGHQVPSQLPLSKSEEKILKKIRRKIKNKISAQESRRKKKEYVDSLEKRMENYINENFELKKRLEDLELNNKSLLNQLQKMQASFSTTNNSCDSDLLDSTSNNTNQFGTLLMVLVLFFAVLLGVWSPILSKDQISYTAATAAASASSATARSSTNSLGSSSATCATTATVAVAAALASATMVSGSATPAIKAESLSPKSEPSEHPGNILTDPDELMSFEATNSPTNDMALTNSTNGAIARSKTGTAVELTKVRPFIRKLPTSTTNILPVKSNLNKGSSDYIMINNNNSNTNGEESQIIILNLAQQQQSQQQPNAQANCNTNTEANLKPISILGCTKNMGMTVTSLNHQNYKVINTNSTTSMVSSPAKLPTRFRVINNNTINNLAVAFTSNSNTNNSIGSNNNSNSPSIIKLSS